MSEINSSEDQALEPDPSTRTRQEALREALKPRRSPEPPREFSTLVQRSEPVEYTPGCADERNCVEHGDPREPMRSKSLDAGLQRVLDAIDRIAARQSRSVAAGGTHSNSDEVQHERDREGSRPAGDERHDRGEDSQD